MANGDGGSRARARSTATTKTAKAARTAKATTTKATKRPAGGGTANGGTANGKPSDLDALLGALLTPQGKAKRPTAATKRSLGEFVTSLGIEHAAPGPETTDAAAGMTAVRERLTAELAKPELAEVVMKRVAGVAGSRSRPRPPAGRPRPQPLPGPRPRPRPRPGVAGAAPPPPPKAVRAKPGNGMALVAWQPVDTAVREYVITTSRIVNGKPKLVGETAVSGTHTRALVRDLDNSAEYSFQVNAVIVVGRDRLPGRPSLPTAPIVPKGEDPDGVVLLLLDDVPLAELFPSATTDAARNLLTNADALGQKWRYEYLKVLAMKAAADALEYENHIASLMAMTLSKITAAEQLLNPSLIEVVNRATDIGTTILSIADSAPVQEILDSLVGVATDALVLPRFILWLSETSPIGFWIGLFEAMIEDVAGFDTGLSHTKAYCQQALDGNIGGTLNAIQDAVADALDRLDTEVDAMVAPLRAAVSEVVQGTSAAMQDVFGAFDLPLTSGLGDPGHVMNVDPLAGLEEELLAKVDELAIDLKKKIKTALETLRDATTGGDGFATLVIVYLAIPVLAFLVIAIAGGPFGAALLAAAVLLAAQELVHLILKLLTGPILKQLDQVLAMARDLTARLREVLADQASIVRAQSPARLLQVLATEMRVIQDVIPQEFLNAAAAILGDARNVVLSTATDLALAAEQALGHENASAFEAIASVYDTNLPRAPMLPGGADPRRHGGAALLRDLARLEEQRTTLTDGKELELTHRLSLFRLLGGQGSPLAPTVAGAFPTFLANGETLVKLTEGDLVDRMFPGVYRALIKDVRVSAVLASAGAPVGVTSSVPLTITHLGESRTRVKRTANPAAPPLQFPVCDEGPEAPNLPSLDPTSEATVTRRIRLEEWLVPGIGGLELRPQLTDVIMVAADEAIHAALVSVPAGAVADLSIAIVAAIIVAAIFGLDLDEIMADIVDAVGRPYVDAVTAGLPAAIAREVEKRSCGFVDFAAVKAGVDQLLFVFGLESLDFLLPILTWALEDFANRQHQAPPPEVFDAHVQALLNVLRSGASSTERGTAPSVPDLVAGAYRDARTRFQHRMARWGKARLEDERDPQVRQLGYATLVREQEPEAAAFNLVSSNAPFLGVGAGQGVVLPGPSAAPPDTPGATLQYRPFENRGLEGSFLFRLTDKMLPPLPVAGSPGSLTDLLKDVVVDVTVKGCFDPNLAAALRSSQQQNVDALRALLPSLADPMPTVGALLGDRVALAPRASERRTVHFSLRSHREKTRQQWLAVLDSTDPLLATVKALVESALPAEARLPLDVNQAFAPLGSVGSDFTFNFAFGNPQPLPLVPTLANLLALAGTLSISRAALGVAPAPVLGTQPGAPGHLCSIGVAVIPMPTGTKPVGGGTDPLNVRLTVPALLRPFLGLPGGSGDVAVPDRLRMTTDVETVTDDGQPAGLPFTAPPLEDLFASSTALGIKIAGPAVTGLRVYDVIVSLSYYVRTLSTATTHSAVR